MNNTHRRTRTALIGAIAATVMAFTAINASIASASSWNTTGQTKVSGSLTFTDNAGSPAQTCAIPLHNGPWAQNVGGWARFTASSTTSAAQILLNCPAASPVVLRFLAIGGGTPTQLYNTIEVLPLTGPWGLSWKQDANTFFSFTSAAGANPAKITLNNQRIAGRNTIASEPIKATGTINITTSTGGPLVLTP